MTAPRGRAAALAFITLTVAIDSIGLGIVIPVLPDVIRRFITDEAQVSRTFGYFVGIYALMQFLSSPVLGRLSDRFGRRPVLLLSLFGAAIDYFVMALSTSLPLLFAGRIISGVSGASYTVASAYVADMSDDGNRSKSFGIMGAGFGLGFIVGPAVGGLLASYGPQYPFLAAGVFNLLNFAFGYLVLPESLPETSRRAFEWRAVNPLHAFREVWRIVPLRPLLFVHGLFHLAGQTHPSIWALYTRHRYGWSAAEIGVSLAVVGTLSALSQGVVTGLAVKRLGERRVFLLGMLGEGVSYFFFGAAATGFMLYAVLTVSSLFWAAMPAMQSLLSRQVTPDHQGALQGVLMSIVSLTAVVNPLVMTSLFSVTSERGVPPYLPGSPYFLGGVFLLSAFWLGWRWNRRESPAVHIGSHFNPSSSL